MLITLTRAVILYSLTIGAVRFMGKRQVGEMQPTELVATILISEIAAIPMQDNDLPILNSVAAVFVLVAFEIINSVISLKSGAYRRLLQGNPAVVIRDGVIDQRQMKRLRLTINDLVSALRQKNAFDINQVAYAVLETDGKLSVLLRSDKCPVTPSDMNLGVEQSEYPVIVVCDGRFVENGVIESGLDKNRIRSIARTNQAQLQDILLMTVDKSGKTNIIRKDNSI